MIASWLLKPMELMLHNILVMLQGWKGELVFLIIRVLEYFPSMHSTLLDLLKVGEVITTTNDHTTNKIY